MSTLVVGSILVVIVVAMIRSVIKARQKGVCLGCSKCSCSECPSCAGAENESLLDTEE